MDETTDTTTNPDGQDESKEEEETDVTVNPDAGTDEQGTDEGDSGSVDEGT